MLHEVISYSKKNKSVQTQNNNSCITGVCQKSLSLYLSWNEYNYIRPLDIEEIGMVI